MSGYCREKRQKCPSESRICGNAFGFRSWYVEDATVRKMIDAGQAPKNSKVVILGLTFKENYPDIRNSKVADIVKRVNEYDIQHAIVDPWAGAEDALREYHVEVTALQDVKEADCIIIAVAHDSFKQMEIEELKKLYGYSDTTGKVLIGVKGIYDRKMHEESGLVWWRL